MALPTMGQTDWAEAIPTLIAQRAMMILKKHATFVRSVYTNGDIASLGTAFSVGSTINIRLPNAYTARDKSEDTVVTFDQNTATKVALVLNKYKYVAIAVEDIAEILVQIGNMSLIDEEAGPIAYAIVQAVEEQLALEYSNFTNAAISTPGVNITPEQVRLAALALDNANVPDDGQRYLKLKPKDVYALLGHPDFIPYFAATQVQAIRDGIVGRMYGFEIDKSQYVYSAAGITYNMAYHRAAIALATRAFKQPISKNVSQSVVADPETGLALTNVMSWDQLYQADTSVTKIVYGTKTLRGSMGVVIEN